MKDQCIGPVHKIRKEKNWTQQLKKEIDKAQVISFDLYNTLVFRKTRTPQDVFAYVEFYTGIPGFMRLRKKMQKKAVKCVRRKDGYPYPNLHEIYKCFRHSGWNVQKAEQLERKLEACLTVRNAAMHRVMQYAKKQGKRIVITSDMYLERAEIEKILNRHSMTQWDALYLSSDIRKTKYNGDMYDYILEKEHKPADKVLHIGDDKRSDIVMAGRKGIRTFWYRNGEADLAKSLYAGSCHKEQLRFEHGLEFWYNLGYQVGGPLYLGLILWLKKTLKNKKLCCLSRDGYLLARLLPKYGIAQASYIYASRRALLIPSLTKIGKKEQELLPPYSCGQSVGEVLSYIGLEGITDKELKEAGFDGFKTVIQNKGDIARCKQLYKNKEKCLLELSRQERDHFKQYFASKGLFEKEVCFFDSGWNGTSQYLLSKIYQVMQKSSSIRFYYAGIRQTSDSKKKLKGCRYQSYFAKYVKKKTLRKLLASSAVLELFFSEDAAAVRCYGQSDAVFDPYEKREYIRCLNQGVEDYLDQNQTLCKVLSAQAVRRFGVCPLVRLVLSPNVREAWRIGNLENADRLSSACKRKKYVAKISKQALKANPLLDIYWEQGVYRHPQNTRYVKLFVWFRQRAAGLYKAVKTAGQKICNSWE